MGGLNFSHRCTQMEHRLALPPIRRGSGGVFNRPEWVGIARTRLEFPVTVPWPERRESFRARAHLLRVRFGEMPKGRQEEVRREGASNGTRGGCGPQNVISKSGSRRAGRRTEGF